MFRLPPNLGIGGQYPAVNAAEVTVLENSLEPRSRVLVGLILAERYEGLEEDCEKAEAALREAGIPTWPEYGRLVTLDPDGEPVVWISYLSSPAWWTLILMVLGGILLLPILSALPLKIIDLLFPGTMSTITSLVTLGIMAGVMLMLSSMFKGVR